MDTLNVNPVVNAVLGGSSANLPVMREDESAIIDDNVEMTDTTNEEPNFQDAVDTVESDDEFESMIDPDLLNRYGCRPARVIPKVLIIRDKVKQRKGRQFADYNVMRRDALLAQFLKLRVENIPVPFRVWNRDREEPELVVQAADDRQATLLLGEHQFGPFEVVVVPHPTRNKVLGKIFDRNGNIERLGIEQATRELAPQGVSKIEKIGKVKGLYKIHLDMFDRPKHIMLGRIQVDVDEFIPFPIRCFRCQEYGHGATWKGGCKKPRRCKRCGGDHEYKSKTVRFGPPEENGTSPPPLPPTFCELPKQCFHCKEAHEVGAKECPIEKSEREAKAVASREKTTVWAVKQRMKQSMAQRVRSVAPQIPHTPLEDRLTRMENMVMKLLNQMQQGSNTAPPGGAERDDVRKLQERMKKMEEDNLRIEEQYREREGRYLKELNDAKEENIRLAKKVSDLAQEGGQQDHVKAMETEIENTRKELSLQRALVKTKEEMILKADQEVRKHKDDLRNKEKALEKASQDLDKAKGELALTSPEQRKKAEECYKDVVLQNAAMLKNIKRNGSGGRPSAGTSSGKSPATTGFSKPTPTIKKVATEVVTKALRGGGNKQSSTVSGDKVGGNRMEED